MNNNLRKIEKDLRAFAKRCKDVKYTQALLYIFLMTGAVSFTATTAESIEGARKEIKTSITDMKKLFGSMVKTTTITDGMEHIKEKEIKSRNISMKEYWKEIVI